MDESRNQLKRAKSFCQRRLAREMHSSRIALFSACRLRLVSQHVENVSSVEFNCIPRSKDEYEVYVEGETIRAAVYGFNRNYRYVERKTLSGDVETTYYGPELSDYRKVVEDENGEVTQVTRVNNHGNGVVKTIYFHDQSTYTEHSSDKSAESYSCLKDRDNRVLALHFADGKSVFFAYRGTQIDASAFIDEAGTEWTKCATSGMFKDCLGNRLGDFPVLSISANDSGSYVFGGMRDTAVFHKDGRVDKAFLPLLANNL